MPRGKFKFYSNAEKKKLMEIAKLSPADREAVLEQASTSFERSVASLKWKMYQLSPSVGGRKMRGERVAVMDAQQVVLHFTSITVDIPNSCLVFTLNRS